MSTRQTPLSPESASLLGFINDRGHITLAQLRPLFPDMFRGQLAKLLAALVSSAWVDFTWNSAGEKTWFVRPDALADLQRLEGAAQSSQVARVPPVAGPRNTNVMTGTYVPSRGPALRPGALDFKGCPSVGYRC